MTIKNPSKFSQLFDFHQTHFFSSFLSSSFFSSSFFSASVESYYFGSSGAGSDSPSAPPS
jgi:hypothetical protein